MHVDLSHTPGLLYALAYWLSSTFYIQLYGSPFSKGRKFGISAGFLALIAGFMTLTDGVSAIGFFPCMGVTVALIFFYIRIATHMPWANAGYYCARAFILGEFSASLAWYLFYFFVTVPGLPLTVWTTILVFAAVHAIILYTMFLLERKYRDGSKLHMCIIVQTYFHIFLNNRELEFNGFEPLSVRLAIFINLNFRDERFHYSMPFHIIHG